MAWLGIWFESLADEGGARSSEWFRGLAEPLVYPYAHSFLEAETERLRRTADPSRIVHRGESFTVYYSLAHDGIETALERQGCRLIRWLFESFASDESRATSARFSEIPVVIHEPDSAKAAALGNALTLLRFLSAQEDQAIAKLALVPWKSLPGGPRQSAEEYENRVIDFLHGELFYPDGIDVFDVLARHDLKRQRTLGACCESQVGFLRSLLDWVDECPPASASEREELTRKLRNSLADEARYWREKRRNTDAPRFV